MELDLDTKQLLADLIAKPEMVSQAHADVLNDLILKFPYYQPLHLLLAKASLNESNAPEILSTAAMYNGGNLLHRIIHHPETLSIDVGIKSSVNPNTAFDEQKVIDENVETSIPVYHQEIEEDKVYDEISEVDHFSKNEKVNKPVDEQGVIDENLEKSSPIHHQEIEEDKVYDEISEVDHFSADVNELPVEQAIIDENADVSRPVHDHEIEEDKVYDEISEIDHFSTDEKVNEIADEQEINNEIVEAKKVNSSPTLPHENQILQEDDLVIENIVSTDFFAFEENFTAEKQVDAVSSELIITPPEEYNLEAEAQTVSKYNDDKLPYTFLWWLAKTRKEHEQIFQPYVSQKKTEPSPTGELQQQYVEHIFHLQSPFNESDENSKGPLNRHIIPKGNDIIDSFIKNDPQIKPPKAEQINTENKAKKSAEDHNNLVSETLAAIYIEQMLYHKAIETYEKLSLKFPEKSRYFADLIQSLEKKI